MIRILHVISTPEGVGGAEVILASLLRAGQERGWDQTILNPFAAESDGGALAAACRSAAPGAAFAAYPARRLHELPGTRRWLTTQLAMVKPEIVHAHLFHAAVLTGSLHQQIAAKTVLTHHHGDHNVAESRRLRTLADRHFGRQFDRVVAISQWVQTFLVESYGYPRELVEVILNGWGGRPLPPRPPRVPTAVCVAHLREQKGHDDLLRAFAFVRTRIPQARLRLVGDGPLAPSLKELARTLDLEANVRFEGAVDDVWPLLSEANVFVLASRYEPLGIAVMEAMAAGLPVVATSVGGLPELVTPHRTGALVPPGNVEALGQAIIDLFESSDYAAISADARSDSAAWHESEMTGKYADLYQRLTQLDGEPA